ncbi:meiotic recombination protein SPO11 isoform X4 [Brachyhypopomus gauderio]|uniref:meiotic recombination protein SPO11 isoform X4 n=1 Tax=Brachyhypopomus gauderio TaxID=698409 RepID=UPI004041D332
MSEQFSEVDKLRAALFQSIQAHSETSTGHSGDIARIDVLTRIENVILKIIQSLSREEAPVLVLKNRSSWSNVRFDQSLGLLMSSDATITTVRSDCPSSVTKFAQVLKCLLSIYRLVQSDSYATKRDIYYNDPQLFGSQKSVDSIVDDISCMLKVPRRSLHVHEDIVSSAKFVLIIEKDATFQRLMDDEFCTQLYPCIIMTGKGVPDVNSRLMVRKLWDTLHIPVFALVDADPHGIEIMCIYKYGSVSMAFEGASLTIPSIKWLGLWPSDIERFGVARDALIPFTQADEKKMNSLRKRPYSSCQPAWESEMELMMRRKCKAEIQSLESIAPQFLTRAYLPNKLRYGDWI